MTCRWSSGRRRRPEPSTSIRERGIQLGLLEADSEVSDSEVGTLISTPGYRRRPKSLSWPVAVSAWMS